MCQWQKQQKIFHFKDNILFLYKTNRLKYKKYYIKILLKRGGMVRQEDMEGSQAAQQAVVADMAVVVWARPRAGRCGLKIKSPIYFIPHLSFNFNRFF